MDQCIELLCFQFASIVKRSSSPCSVGSGVSSTHTQYAAVLLTRLRAAFFFACVVSENRMARGRVWGQVKTVGAVVLRNSLPLIPGLFFIVLSDPQRNPPLVTGQGCHGPPLSILCPARCCNWAGLWDCFFFLFFFKPCVFPRCNLKPVVNNQNGERWEGFP